MAGFITYRVAKLKPPLNGDQAETWATALGSVQDEELALLRVAALSRFPATCPDDGLDLLGQAFALPRLPGQSNDSYRQTLANAFPTYELGGSISGVVDALKAYGFVDADVLPIFESPAPIAPETSASSYSAFYVKLGPNMGSTGVAPLTLGSWILGSTTSSLGSTMSQLQLKGLKKLVLRWKAAHGYPLKIILDFGDGWTSAAAYPLGRTLGDGLPVLGDVNCILGGYIV